MTTLTPSIGNLSVQEIYTTVTQKGLNESQANAFVGEWLLVNSGKAKRIFNYSQTFDAVDANAKSSFARGFVHQDWIDGRAPCKPAKHLMRPASTAAFIASKRISTRSARTWH